MFLALVVFINPYDLAKSQAFQQPNLLQYYLPVLGSFLRCNLPVL
ncbi:hypothetical protein CGSMWGv1500E_00330 [Gardnerella vaginalis 1500E]|uniref:Uncharacterized protein n=1 Tax=Gardnerella vaginalis 1500E TaxID=698957 RepID=I4M4J5_GARVA|nr:hypothetical protein CGSMWGv1500E_00330 [Gardnerella vaginalis 1500E]